MEQIDNFYDQLTEWSKSIDVSRDACLSPSANKNAGDLVYLELFAAGNILRNFESLINELNEKKG
jgi:hypothetical protein